jgi:hypothetical protein
MRVHAQFGEALPVASPNRGEKMADYNDTYYDDDADDSADDFDKRTWKVTKTVQDGFAIGSLFTYKDLVCMKEMIPCLEGMTFVNIKTGKVRVLRNKECNARRIILIAEEELSGTGHEYLVYGLDRTRKSVDILVSRICMSHIDVSSPIRKMKFYKALVKYFGEDICR